MAWILDQVAAEKEYRMSTNGAGAPSRIEGAAESRITGYLFPIFDGQIDYEAPDLNLSAFDVREEEIYVTLPGIDEGDPQTILMEVPSGRLLLVNDGYAPIDDQIRDRLLSFLQATLPEAVFTLSESEAASDVLDANFDEGAPESSRGYRGLGAGF